MTKLQWIKVRRVTHPFRCIVSYKNAKLKLHHLKGVVIIATLFLFFMFLWSSTYFHHGKHLVPGVIRSDTNHRYTSDVDINWENISGVVNRLPQDKHQEIGLLNFNENEIYKWKHLFPIANHTVLSLDHVDKNMTWELLYPEWIDEEQDEEVPTCPTFPSIQVPRRRLDLIAVKLPCHNKNWSRDITRLHLQITVAHLAASYKGNHQLHVLFLSLCFPLPNLFCCKDLVARERDVWLYKPNLTKLRERIRLPIGSCELALPLGDDTGPNIAALWKPRVAYATILHSSAAYVCGATVVAQSIRMSGSTVDLIILVDESIGNYHRAALAQAGWKVRTIQRIRNPKAEKDSYNEWNYSKFRLWQLTDYDKIIFVDADMLVLRNIDFLFTLPEITASGNEGPWFNSGVMVIEPSNCTFRLLMDHIDEIESYNGGDQGYLNEIFPWWHRMPRRMNFLKHFWSGDDKAAREKKNRVMGAEPAVVYVIHYLGSKPWRCYRDYDCNWNVEGQREFASDVAHARWWKVHDAMAGEVLRETCLLKTVRKAELEVDRREVEKGKFKDGHWRVEIRDERERRCMDGESECNWKGMLRHWVYK